MNTSSPATFTPRRAKPNSAACLTQLIVSPPALARPTTLARDACACTRKDEKSEVAGKGVRTCPATLPPAARTKFAVSRSSAWPKA